MILDGWGEGPKDSRNAVFVQGTPNLDSLRREFPNSLLVASGEEVGLPAGQMGNSEVGHLNIGAGRVVYQDLAKINRDCRSGELEKREEMTALFKYVKESGKALHLIGLVSDGGVHSSIEHLFAIIEAANRASIDTIFVHAFTDGRDTDPNSGIEHMRELQKFLDGGKRGKLASIIGRYYAMDRDKRWDRIEKAYNLLVKGEGTPYEDGVEAIEESYKRDITDEFVRASVIVTPKGEPVATIGEEDAVLFFNFRNDRARELTMALSQGGVEEEGMEPLPLYFVTLTPYDQKFKGAHVVYQKEDLAGTIGEVIANNGLKQLRIAETEKYAHVTFFFSGGREREFDGEERVLIPSPMIPTYDLKPDMSAYEIKERLVELLDEQRFDFIVLNFANCDMVGHTGKFEAIKKAVKTVDQYSSEIVERARKNGYSVVVTADHGNADNAINSDGTPNTAHSLNPVPFIVIDNRVERVEGGRLADIAPTLLELMGVDPSPQMEGRSLLHFYK